MKPKGIHFAASCAAIIQTAFAWPRLRAAFLLLLFSLAPSLAHAQNTNPPYFTTAFSNTGSVTSSANQLTYAPHLTFTTNGVQPTGHAEVTNGTSMFFAFLSNSLGDTNLPSSVGFSMPAHVGTKTNMSTIPGIVSPDPTDTNVWYANGGTSSNLSPFPVWMGINLTPGTNTNPVTNYVRVLAFNGNNNSNTNWATTNLVLVSKPAVPFTAFLGITFTNYGYTNDPNLTNVWLSLETNASISNTIGYISNSTTNVTWSVGNVMSDPVALSTVNSNGGLAFTSGSSVIGYISYGTKLGSLSNVPSPVNTNDASHQTPWVQFELTRGGTAAGLLVGDVGDLTFINEFSAPLYIKSYDTNGHQLQYSGFFSNSTATIFQSLAALTRTNPAAVITNASGQFVRVIAPVSFSNFVGPYDNFHTYITNLAASSTVAHLQNYSAFPVQGNGNTNILFRFNMTNHFKSDGTLEILGTVTASNTVPPYTPANTFSNLKILYATNATSTVTDIGGALYGANFASASNTIFFVDADEGQTGAGANWLAMSNWMVAQYGTNTNYQTGSNAYYTVLAQMVGEVSATIESGLAGSTNVVSNGGVSGVLGTNLSDNWWTMTNPLSIMRNAQTNPLNYNQYGDVIFYYSSNSVYNFSYNDRYNNAKPVVFVNQYNGTNVGSWVIGVGAPVSTVRPDPTPPSFQSTFAPSHTSTNLGSVPVGIHTNAQVWLIHTNLSGSVRVMAPRGFHVSSDGTNWSRALVIPQESLGSVSSNQLFIKLLVGSPGVKSGNIKVSSKGAANQYIAVQGAVTNTNGIIPKPGSLNKLVATSPDPGRSKSFTVKTTGITESILVTAPPGFQVGRKGEGLGAALMLPPQGGAVNVRIAGNALGPVTNVSGIITLLASGHSNSVTVAGKVSGSSSPALILSNSFGATNGTLSFNPQTLTIPPTALGTPSEAAVFSINGSGLPGPVEVTGVDPSFELATNSAGPWTADPVTLTPSGGSLVNAPVYVRTTGTSAGSFTDTVTGYVGGTNYAQGTARGVVGSTDSPALILLPNQEDGLGRFVTMQGQPSAYQSLELIGSQLPGKAAVTVDALPGFQVSGSPAGRWGQSITMRADRLAPIYVRLSGIQAGFLPDYSFSGNVTAYGGGTDTSIAVGGSTYPKSGLIASTRGFKQFSTTQGVPSAVQACSFGPVAPSSYGNTNQVIITAPAGFEISTDGSNFKPSLVYTPAGPEWTSGLYVRISASAGEGRVGGKVTLATLGLAFDKPHEPVEIKVSGKVTP